ncbi:hypothetical protein [Tessaracoccus sp.]
MNRFREAVLAQMTHAGLDFTPETVRVVAFEFETGMSSTSPDNFADVTIVIDVTHETQGGHRTNSVVLIPVEGWCEPWVLIQRAFMDAANMPT